MRYCPECLTIYENEGNVCAPCNEKTVDIGVTKTNQVPLFPPSDEDRVKSVYDSLKSGYRDTLEAVAKAEKKLREACAERDRSATILLDYDAVVKGKAIKGLPAHEEDDEDILLVGNGAEE